MDTQRKTVMDEVVHLIRVSILTDSVSYNSWRNYFTKSVWA